MSAVSGSQALDNIDCVEYSVLGDKYIRGCKSRWYSLTLCRVKYALTVLLR